MAPPPPPPAPQDSSAEETYHGFDLNAGRSWIYPTNYPEREYQFRKALFYIYCIHFENAMKCKLLQDRRVLPVRQHIGHPSHWAREDLHRRCGYVQLFPLVPALQDRLHGPDEAPRAATDRGVLQHHGDPAN